MSIRNGVARGLKWQAFRTIGRQLASLVVFTALARVLSPSDFGLMGLIFVYLTIAAMLADQGISTALIQRAELRPEHWDAAFWFNLGCSGLLCIGTIAFAGPLAGILGEPRLTPLLRWSSLSLIFSTASSIQLSVFTRELDFRRPAVSALISYVAGGVIGIAMAVSGWGVWSLVGQQLSASLVGAAYTWSVSAYRPTLGFSWSALRDLFSVSSSVFANTLIWSLTSRLDQLVVGRFGGAEALGLYVVAGKIPEIAKMAVEQPIREISVPALSRLQHDHGRMREAIYRGVGLNAIVMFALFAGLAVVAPDLLPVLFGQNWVAAAPLCSLLSIYALVSALQLFGYPAVIASGSMVQYVALTASYSTGVVIACLVGMKFGTTYLILGLTANSLIQAVPCVAHLRRRIGLNWTSYCSPCLIPAGAAVFMVGAIQIVSLLLTAHAPQLWRLVCHVVVGAAAYLGFLRAFANGGLTELVQIVVAALRRSDPLNESTRS